MYPIFTKSHARKTQGSRQRRQRPVHKPRFGTLGGSSRRSSTPLVEAPATRALAYRPVSPGGVAPTQGYPGSDIFRWYQNPNPTLRQDPQAQDGPCPTLEDKVELAEHGQDLNDCPTSLCPAPQRRRYIPCRAEHRQPYLPTPADAGLEDNEADYVMSEDMEAYILWLEDQVRRSEVQVCSLIEAVSDPYANPTSPSADQYKPMRTPPTLPPVEEYPESDLDLDLADLAPPQPRVRVFKRQMGPIKCRQCNRTLKSWRDDCPCKRSFSEPDSDSDYDYEEPVPPRDRPQEYWEIPQPATVPHVPGPRVEYACVDDQEYVHVTGDLEQAYVEMMVRDNIPFTRAGAAGFLEKKVAADALDEHVALVLAGYDDMLETIGEELRRQVAAMGPSEGQWNAACLHLSLRGLGKDRRALTLLELRAMASIREKTGWVPGAKRRLAAARSAAAIYHVPPSPTETKRRYVGAAYKGEYPEIQSDETCKLTIRRGYNPHKGKLTLRQSVMAMTRCIKARQLKEYRDEPMTAITLWRDLLKVPLLDYIPWNQLPEWRRAPTTSVQKWVAEAAFPRTTGWYKSDQIRKAKALANAAMRYVAGRGKDVVVPVSDKPKRVISATARRRGKAKKISRLEHKARIDYLVASDDYPLITMKGYSKYSAKQMQETRERLDREAEESDMMFGGDDD